VLVFRDEDLDPQRSRRDYALAMLEDLRWLGIEWQEGPDIGGPYAPYEQSARRDFYLAEWRQLVAQGAVYACDCSRRDLAQSTQAPHESAVHDANDEPIYPGTCREKRLERVPDSPAGRNWRFRVPDGEEIRFRDHPLGEVSYTAGRDFGDFVVWRRDDVPSYQLAVVVDDAAMRITEVVRGEDLLRSTARQILLQRALRLPAVEYFHCALMTDEFGQRLAKRHDALSLKTLRERGVSAEDLRRGWESSG
jgi:glutamyl-tRNA synthetase